MSEIEFKFVIDEPTANLLWKRSQSAELMASRRKTRVLTSTYMDTPEHALWRAGIALRLRREGRRWTQTVKAQRQLHGGLSEAEEHEAPAPGGKAKLQAIADARLRDEILGLVKGSPLLAVCETRMKRTTAELSLEDGTRAILSTDAGAIHAGDRTSDFREAEIELIEGGVDGLFRIAHVLFPDGGLNFSRLSKGERGYMLASEGRIDPPLAPRKAMPVELRRDQTAREAARDIVRECIDQITFNIRVVGKLDDPEGPHQLRVGLRRLRSALSLFASVLVDPERDRLEGEVRWLAREVGQLRDIDAVLHDIVLNKAKTHPREDGLRVLAEALRKEAGVARRGLRSVLVSPRVQAMQIDLVRLAEGRDGAGATDDPEAKDCSLDVVETARAALHKTFRKVRKRARHIAKLTPSERHQLRKELKAFRYTMEFFSSLFPARRSTPFLDRLKKLLEVFGDLNDAVVLNELFSPDGLSIAGEPSLQRPIGWLAGTSEARGEIKWGDAQMLWKKLKKTQIFWDK